MSRPEAQGHRVPTISGTSVPTCREERRVLALPHPPARRARLELNHQLAVRPSLIWSRGPPTLADRSKGGYRHGSRSRKNPSPPERLGPCRGGGTEPAGTVSHPAGETGARL